MRREHHLEALQDVLDPEEGEDQELKRVQLTHHTGIGDQKLPSVQRQPHGLLHQPASRRQRRCEKSEFVDAK